MDPMPEPELMTTPEVSSLTRLASETLRYYRHRGTGPASFKLGGRVVYRRADVLAWIEEQREAQGGAGGAA